MLLEIQSADREQNGPARIFTLSLDPYQRNLTVSQEGTDLSVRMRNRHTSLNGRPDYVIKEVFTDLDWHKIDIRITSTSLEIRINRDKLASFPLPDRPLESWDTGYRLAFGNELTGDRPWRGGIRKAVIHTDATSIDYLASDHLIVPDTYKVISDRRGQFTPFIRDRYTRALFVDWTVNFLGFMPLGWLLVMYRRPHPGFLFAVILSAGVSVVIEASQLLFFAGRLPSTEDLILNTLGGAAGAWLARDFDVSLTRRPTHAS